MDEFKERFYKVTRHLGVDTCREIYYLRKNIYYTYMDNGDDYIWDKVFRDLTEGFDIKTVDRDAREPPARP